MENLEYFKTSELITPIAHHLELLMENFDFAENPMVNAIFATTPNKGNFLCWKLFCFQCSFETFKLQTLVTYM